MTHLNKQQGFTLIELLVTTAIGLIIMAGMTSVFISQTRTATMLKNKTEAMGDLFLASQIMQSELRGAKKICWDGASVLSYQPIDSLTPCGGVSVLPENGSFTYKKNTATDWHIMWKPQKTSKTKGTRTDELLRGLPAPGGVPTTAGLVVTPHLPLSTPQMYVIDLQSNFTGQANQAKTLGLTFKVWARN